MYIYISIIIAGRTRRQSAREATHRTYTYDESEDPASAHSNINKFTPILDSDSDSD